MDEYGNLTNYLAVLMLARLSPGFDAVTVVLRAEDFLPYKQLKKFIPKDGKYRPSALNLLDSVAKRLVALTSQNPNMQIITQISLMNIETIKNGL